MFPPTRANFPVVNANVRHWFSLTREGAGCSTNRSLLASVSSEHAKTLTVCLPHNYRHEEGRSSLTTPPLCQCACVKARKLGSSKLHVSLIHYLNLVALPGKTTPPPHPPQHTHTLYPLQIHSSVVCRSSVVRQQSLSLSASSQMMMMMMVVTIMMMSTFIAHDSIKLNAQCAQKGWWWGWIGIKIKLFREQVMFQTSAERRQRVSDDNVLVYIKRETEREGHSSGQHTLTHKQQTQPK